MSLFDQRGQSVGGTQVNSVTNAVNRQLVEINKIAIRALEEIADPANSSRALDIAEGALGEIRLME